MKYGSGLGSEFRVGGFRLADSKRAGECDKLNGIFAKHFQMYITKPSARVPGQPCTAIFSKHSSLMIAITSVLALPAEAATGPQS